MREKPCMSVAALTAYIKTLLSYDELLSSVRVKGEISNLKYHSSGHVYFSLKDEKAVVKCVLFRSNAAKLSWVLQNGDHVEVTGRIDVYEASGTYQIYISSVKKAGLGDLYLRYTMLMQKLKEKGYFDEDHKKSLPLYPKTVALITSKTSAAVRDMISILRRRCPGINVLVCPVRVQGTGASEEIAAMIRYVNAHEAVDVIIVGRGGGSFEDLFAFSEEIVADAVYESHIPVISAVGHETDYSLCDFTADLRAPTPSAAAELAVQEMSQVLAFLNDSSQRLLKDIVARLMALREKVDGLQAHRVFREPESLLMQYQQRLDELSTRLTEGMLRKLAFYKHKVNAFGRTLDALSFANILQRGYAIVRQENRVLTRAADFDSHASVALQFYDGTVESLRQCTIDEEGAENEV